jgi:hypothetical protein
MGDSPPTTPAATPPATRPDPPGKSALLAATEFIKYTITLGTGTLVFSGGLVTQKVTLSWFSIIVLIISWVALAASVVAGVLAYSRIPILLAEENYDLEDRFFTLPGKVHQIGFLIGIVCLGIVLISTVASSAISAPSTTTPTPSLTPSIVPSLTASSTPPMLMTPTEVATTPVMTPTP